jgi:hypothetical protein
MKSLAPLPDTVNESDIDIGFPSDIDFYFLLPIAVFIPIFAVYILTHTYPANAGGLFLAMAEAIRANGYILPEYIPHYTDGGIPFGYPPFMLYVATILKQIGMSYLTIELFLPGILFSGSLVAFYFFFLELLGDRDRAVVASVIIATSPMMLEDTIDAGGFVRSAGLLFTVLGLHSGLYVFKNRSWRWTPIAVGFFSITSITHLRYTLFFAVSFLVFYLWFDRTIQGLIKGGSVAVGGIVLASPWWLTVAGNHGFGVFLHAGSTHGGIGGINWIWQFLRMTSSPMSLWPPLIVVGGLYLVVQNKLFLPVWFSTVGFINDYLIIVIGAPIAATFLFEAVVPNIQQFHHKTKIGISRSFLVILFLSSLSIYAIISGAFFVEDGLPSENQFISFIDSDDVEAMEWARQNTPEDSMFLVIGEASEWFPYFAERTTMVVTRGTEWNGKRSHMRSLRARLGDCLTAECITEVTKRNSLNSDYLYISRYRYYYGRDLVDIRWNHLPDDLNSCPNYELVFMNEDVAIFRYQH